MWSNNECQDFLVVKDDIKDAADDGSLLLSLQPPPFQLAMSCVIGVNDKELCSFEPTVDEWCSGHTSR